MSKEAMKLALEALELMYACYAHPEWISHKQQEEKILAQCAATTMTLRQTLAKQEQRSDSEHLGEPVAYGMRDTMIGNGNRMMYVRLDKGQDGCTVPLYEHPQPNQEQGEPVAWRAPNWGHSADEYVYRDFDDPVIGIDGKPSPNNEPLYTTTQQRTWVGLTDEEIDKWNIVGHESLREFVRAIEAKLKEKNT